MIVNRPAMAAFATLGTVACSTSIVGPPPISIPTYEVVFELSGGGVPWELTSAPDGSLFLASESGIFRATAEDYTAWTQLTTEPFPAQDLFSPGRESVFGVAGNGSVYRWHVQGGWERMSTPVSDSIVLDHDWSYGISLDGLWGTAETDIYAVGWGATILHFDGEEWTSVQNPMHAIVDSGGPAASRARLRGVTGKDNELYATAYDILHFRDGNWSWIARPDTGQASHFCGFNAAAMYEGSLYVAGGERACMLRLTPTGKWEDVTQLIAGFSSPGPFGGATQHDASALFWASAYGEADVLRLYEHRSRIYRFTDLGWFGGAAIAGGSLFATGMKADTLIVVRTALEAP